MPALGGLITIFGEMNPGLHLGEVWCVVIQRSFSGKNKNNDHEKVEKSEA